MPSFLSAVTIYERDLKSDTGVVLFSRCREKLSLGRAEVLPGQKSDFTKKSRLSRAGVFLWIACLTKLLENECCENVPLFLEKTEQKLHPRARMQFLFHKNAQIHNKNGTATITVDPAIRPPGNPPVQPITHPTTRQFICPAGNPASAHSAVLVQHGLNAFLHDGNDVIQSFRA